MHTDTHTRCLARARLECQLGKNRARRGAWGRAWESGSVGEDRMSQGGVGYREEREWDFLKFVFYIEFLGYFYSGVARGLFRDFCAVRNQ